MRVDIEWITKQRIGSLFTETLDYISIAL